MEFGENDYKYVMSEISRTLIGARYTYGELMQDDRVPFKFQTIVDRLILPYTAPDTRIGEHIYHMEKDDKNYRIYDGLKLKLGVYTPDQKRNGYKASVVTLAGVPTLKEKWGEEAFIYEISLSNLALMAFLM